MYIWYSYGFHFCTRARLFDNHTNSYNRWDTVPLQVWLRYEGVSIDILFSRRRSWNPWEFIDPIRGDLYMWYSFEVHSVAKGCLLNKGVWVFQWFGTNWRDTYLTPHAFYDHYKRNADFLTNRWKARNMLASTATKKIKSTTLKDSKKWSMKTVCQASSK